MADDDAAGSRDSAAAGLGVGMPLLPELWQLIADETEDVADYLHLARTSRAMHAMLMRDVRGVVERAINGTTAACTPDGWAEFLEGECALETLFPALDLRAFTDALAKTQAMRAVAALPLTPVAEVKARGGGDAGAYVLVGSGARSAVIEALRALPRTPTTRAPWPWPAPELTTTFAQLDIWVPTWSLPVWEASSLLPDGRRLHDTLARFHAYAPVLPQRCMSMLQAQERPWCIKGCRAAHNEATYTKKRTTLSCVSITAAQFAVRFYPGFPGASRVLCTRLAAYSLLTRTAFVTGNKRTFFSFFMDLDVVASQNMADTVRMASVLAYVQRGHHFAQHSPSCDAGSNLSFVIQLAPPQAALLGCKDLRRCNTCKRFVTPTPTLPRPKQGLVLPLVPPPFLETLLAQLPQMAPGADDDLHVTGDV